MAQNDPLPTVSHVYLRKDRQFFADGMWYISTPCSVHGLVDESVTWAEAKTPHHAGVIADARHAECGVDDEVRMIAEVGKAEIAVAEALLDQQRINLAAARKALATVKSPISIITAADLRTQPARIQEAQDNLARHERGLIEAEKRVADIRRDNG